MKFVLKFLDKITEKPREGSATGLPAFVEMRKYYDSDYSHQEARLILGQYLKVCYEYFLLLTPQCRVFFFKLIVTKVVKKFLTYMVHYLP
jgi:hypothetical protein